MLLMLPCLVCALADMRNSKLFLYAILLHCSILYIYDHDAFTQNLKANECYINGSAWPVHLKSIKFKGSSPLYLHTTGTSTPEI